MATKDLEATIERLKAVYEIQNVLTRGIPFLKLNRD
jgi:hypothetical protein